MSLSGKTSLATRIIPQLIARKIPIVAYSTEPEAQWLKPGVQFTMDPDKLEFLLKKNAGKSTIVYIDEAPSVFDEVKHRTHPLIYSLTSRGRHKGFNARIITTFPTTIPAFIRSNLHNLEVFKLQNEDQSRQVIIDKGLPKSWAEEIRRLRPLQYISIRPNAEPVKKRL